ncbi:ribosomal protein L7/L12 [Parenemella sanctibonifatiensis]|uniref:Uncharacterized protein n=1 Tax=Parenemella sanctibonifatiensis TaxID=2016505 RepID=A0A255EM04_9ACTN|nr:ribosomal protein L7/L12 [Parenemella sanctibonifatiensis]OYN92011.1 hypothetical protein CGZ91_00310 [Parenemella sanctibonifatiensis]
MLFKSHLEDQVADLRRRVRSQQHLIDQLAQHVGLDLGTIDPYAVSQEVRDLVAQGKKIEAIKLYREQTGVGLADAKRAVEDATEI